MFVSGFYQVFKSWGEPSFFSFGDTLAATGIAFVVALGVIAFFMNWISKRSFLPFVIYRILLGGTLIALLSTGVLQP